MVVRVWKWRSRRQSALRSFFEWCYRHDLIPANPMGKFDAPKVSSGLPRPIPTMFCAPYGGDYPSLDPVIHSALKSLVGQLRSLDSGLYTEIYNLICVGDFYMDNHATTQLQAFLCYAPAKRWIDYRRLDRNFMGGYTDPHIMPNLRKPYSYIVF